MNKKNNIFLKIWNDKYLTELYLGIVPYEWQYAKVSYTANCTVSEPFDLFDKTIVGILLLDGQATMEDLGDILGMNIREDPNSYKDSAEYDILTIALNNLSKYDMVEVDYNETYRLTDVGRVYAAQQRKFKTIPQHQFKLYFDLTSKAHEFALERFGQVEPSYTQNRLSSDVWNDKSWIRQVAARQCPDIANAAVGHYFDKEMVEEAILCTLKLKIAVLYDVETQKIRLLAYDAVTQNRYKFMDNWLEVNDLDKIIARLPPQNRSNQRLSTDYIQALMDKKEAFEAVFENDPNQAIQLVQQRNEQLNWIEWLYFQEHLSKFVPEDATEIWIFLPREQKDLLPQLLTLESTQKTIFLIAQNLADAPDGFVEKSYELDSNFYVAQNDELTDFGMWLISKNPKLLILSNIQLNYFKNINLNCPLLEVDLPSMDAQQEMKIGIAHSVLPELVKKLRNFVHAYDSKNMSLAKLMELKDLDKKVQIFASLERDNVIKTQMNAIWDIKKRFIKVVQDAHQTQLQQKLETWTTHFQKIAFQKLEQLHEESQKLDKLEQDASPEYQTFQSLLQTARQRIAEETQRVKDQVLIKMYVIDTNIFIMDPEIMQKIDFQHQICVPNMVLDELDKHKTKPQTKQNAEKVIKLLNAQLNKNPRLKSQKSNLNVLPSDYQQPSPDNRILSVAYTCQSRGENVVLLTNDNGLQVKAKTLNISVLGLKELLELPINPQPVEKSVAPSQPVEKNITLPQKNIKNNNYINPHKRKR